jgi:hypothetical protein
VLETKDYHIKRRFGISINADGKYIVCSIIGMRCVRYIPLVNEIPYDTREEAENRVTGLTQ